MKKYETLATFYCENTRKHYLIFTDNQTDHDNRLHNYASIYLPNQNEFRLFPIKTEKEWEYIEEFIKTHLSQN